MSTTNRYWDLRAAYDWIVWHTPLLSSVSRDEYDSILDLVEQAKPASHEVVLHIGCGAKAGALSDVFEGTTIHFDQSLSMLKWSRKDEPDGIFVNGDTMHLPFRDRSISTIIVVGLTEYIPIPRLWLGECARVLQPGGLILFTVSQPNWKNSLRKLWTSTLFIRTDAEWRRYCAWNNLKIEAMVETPLQLQFRCRKQ